MKKLRFQRFFSAVMVVFLVLAIQQPMLVQAENSESTNSYSEAPPLLITELVPDTTDIGDADGFEFIEVYNNTDKTLNFSDFRILYRYPSGPENDLTWIPHVRDLKIDSGETLVLWMENSANSEATVDDFNANFGTNLIENENIVKMPGGMSNARLRDIIISTNTGTEIAVATYNHGTDDVEPNMGIFYQYPQDGTNQLIKYSSGIEPATPGTVEPELVPEELTTVAENEKPTIEDLTEVSQQFNQVEVVADAQDTFLLTTMSLYYKNDQQDNYTEANLMRDSSDGLLRYKIPLQVVTGAESIQYYLAASNGINTTTTDVQTIDIVEPTENVETAPLLITEIVPDSDNFSSADGYEFIEVYNNTNQPLNMGDYHILYRYPTGSPDRVWFDGLDDITIEAGGNLVLWVDNGVNSEATLEDFNNNYGTSLVENVDIVKAPADGGMANGSERDIVLATNTGEELVVASYNDGTKDDTLPNLGIFYHYPVDSNHMNKVSAAEKTATPGIVEEEYIPSELLTVDPNGVPTINNLTEEQSVQPGNPIEFIVDGQDDFIITDLTLYYKSSDENDYSPVVLKRDTENGLFRHIIELEENISVESIEYYFVASNGFNQTESPIYTVDILVEYIPEVPELVSPVDGATDLTTNTQLSVNVSDPSGEPVDVSFHQGMSYNVSQQSIKIHKNTADTEPPPQLVTEGEVEFTEEEYKRLFSTNGKQVVTDSEEQFPYHRFEVTLDEVALQQEMVELVWKGSSLAGRTISMYAWDFEIEKWVIVDTLQADSEETVELIGEVSVDNYVRDKKINVLVQDEIPPPSEFDYSFVWMADTQFYTEVFPELFEDQVNWIRDNKEELKIEYVFHSGDIVNTVNQEYQWKFADQYMGVLEEADIPYGVIAGNHDVGLPEVDYTEFSKYFGAHRFKDQPYYGESYKDNRGHYDLISAQGNDYIMVHMGWQPTDEGIDWMNAVLDRFSDRIAIINVHQYLSASGTRTPMGDTLFEEVVIPNENVMIVLGGHYHGSKVLTDEIDDNGDGTIDREVHQLLGDFQDANRGGDGYMNVMSVDASTNTIYVNTYSPTLDSYDLFAPYSISLDLEPQTKRIATDYFEVNAYSNEEIGTVLGVESGSDAEVLWEGLNEGQVYQWYVKVSNQTGAVTVSDMWQFTTKEIEQIVDIASIRSLIEDYIALDDLRGPLSSQLSNTGRQAEHHYDRGNMKQAIKFAEKFLEQLNKKQMQNHISPEAKEDLQQKVEELLEQWT